jgi:Ulp1 protease family, C-terminal catalytic domain
MPIVTRATSPSRKARPNKVPKQAYPFLQDPRKGTKLNVNDDNINPLDGSYWLGTTLIDYLLQQSICDGDNPDNLIIPSSEADALMTIHLNKNKLDDKRSISSCNVMRRNYSYYATREFCLVATICHSGHFFVTKVIFDVTKDTIFKEVTVYDSLRRGNRNKEAMKPNSPAAELLCKLQSFLSCFVFYDAANSKMLDDSRFILKNATYVTCPNQRNSHDCGLFGVGTLLHVLAKIPITEDMFTQNDISNFRSSLYSVLHGEGTSFFSDPKKNLSRAFVNVLLP